MKEVLAYVERMWDELTCSQTQDAGVSIGVPNNFIAPNKDNYESNLFYWDSYFIILGLLKSNRVELAKGIVDNFCYLIDRFGFVPMRNRFYDTGISQPPFLTSMIREIYAITKDEDWLTNTIPKARIEYDMYWQDGSFKIPMHKNHEVLNRYCDHHVISATSEHESGWDMTSRFNSECLNYCPIDLNSLLYKYEVDLAWYYSKIGDQETANYYAELAQKRKQLVSELCYDKFFFDFNTQTNERSDFLSLAGFYPLWAGLATKEQAQSCVAYIDTFLEKGGLANTVCVPHKQFRQWDYPNGWAPNQWIVITALRNYGYDEQAKEIAKRFLNLAHDLFHKTKTLWEKYDVVNYDVGKNGRYPTQSGFGWTNAFVILAHNYLRN